MTEDDDDALDALLEEATTARPAGPRILDPSGQPARRPGVRSCPRCGAGPDRRVRSGGFGPDVQDLCGRCGHAFGELTV